MTRRILPAAVRPVTALTAAAMAVPAALAAPSVPAAAGSTVTVGCTSAQPGLADQLTQDITAALAGRAGTVALGLRDRATDTTCLLRPDRAYDAASVVKVTVLAALLWTKQMTGSSLTPEEAELASAMITRSDNDATNALWHELGVPAVQAFLDAAGMTATVPGSGGYWGLTQITVRDELRLLELLTGDNPVLGAGSREYVLYLMANVIADQRWGTPAGAPLGVSVHVKNGWLPRATHGWRVHSIGAFEGGGHDYTIVVLTQDNATMPYGVNTIQAVARTIHKDLFPATADQDRYQPTDTPDETIPQVPWS